MIGGPIAGSSIAGPFAPSVQETPVAFVASAHLSGLSGASGVASSSLIANGCIVAHAHATAIAASPTSFGALCVQWHNGRSPFAVRSSIVQRRATADGGSPIAVAASGGSPYLVAAQQSCCGDCH